MKKFAPDFLVGAATAAHQVEGNNIYSDCWAQEQMPHSVYVEPSLNAVDHYHRYEEDISLLAEAGLNAYRFSIEWARIEPEEGKFVESEVEHYRQVIACCKAHGVEPVVTLHHFSSPAWLITKGGWQAESTVDYFVRYVRYVIKRLGSELHYVCTINEANMGLQVAAISQRMIRQMQAMADRGQTPGGDGRAQMGLNLEKMMANAQAAAVENVAVFGTPQPHTFTSALSAEGDAIIMKAHAAARDAIKEIFPDLKVGLTLSLHDFQPVAGGEESAAKEWDDELLHYLPVIGQDDFLGVQNYTRMLMGPEGSLPTPEGAELTQMDYEFYPEALEHVLRKIAQVYHGDLLVTENGIATADDTHRVEFIQRATDGVANCVADGIPVKGYFYWSLLDNFEWQKGFSMTFGVIAVDRTTQKRIPKPSFSVLGSLR
ncbi:MAG: family 1 glycosylhydrolase [Oscillospiraceae bacterium]|nr:family 1 glycosylhydrolase [Oscillospiraceae bacterium]